MFASVASAELIDGRFQIDAEVASGGMGTVFRGRDLQSEEPVAIKVLQLTGSADAERFAREAALLAQVSHPGIVRYLAHGITPEDRQYLVMEWIDGETLRDRLSRQGLTIHESVLMARRVAEALDEMHRRGIIHRDVKPSNLIFPEGVVDRVKLLDFGIARRSDDLIGLTRTGVMVGSPGYMAPEQARGDRSVLDARADLFSLGCVLYECLTGRPPFFGDPLAVRAKVLLADPPAIREANPDVSPGLQDLVDELLSKDRGQRPADAAHLAKQLTGLREISGTPRPQQPNASPSTPTAVIRPPRENQVTFLVFAAAQAEEALSSSEESDRKRALEEAVASHGGRLECLDGKWWMVVLSGGGVPSELAARAASCALQIRGVLPSVPMALVAERSRAKLDALIDRGASTVTSESIVSLFADAISPAHSAEEIRLDEATTELLQSDRFDVTRRADGIYLRAQAAGQAPRS